MDTGDKVFNPVEFWITVNLNRDREQVDLIAWHPLFGRMQEKDRWPVFFLFLDVVLGELETQQWIGEIQLNDQKLADAMPLEELSSFLKEVETETGWKKLPPGESVMIYPTEQPHQWFLRADVIAGSTMNFRLIGEYLDAQGELRGPLAGTRADFVSVSFNARFLPDGRQSETRGFIEDALAGGIEVRLHLGGCSGGAFGTRKRLHRPVALWTVVISLKRCNESW